MEFLFLCFGADDDKYDEENSVMDAKKMWQNSPGGRVTRFWMASKCEREKDSKGKKTRLQMRLMRQMPMQWALRLGVCVVVNVVSHLVHVCGKCVVQKSILFRGCILRFFLTRHDAKWSRHVCYDIHMTLCERMQPSITLFDFSPLLVQL